MARCTARPGAFDLVITDQMMPELTGTDLALKILAIRPDIPVILTQAIIPSSRPERLDADGNIESCL